MTEEFASLANEIPIIEQLKGQGEEKKGFDRDLNS